MSRLWLIAVAGGAPTLLLVVFALLLYMDSP